MRTEPDGTLVLTREDLEDALDRLDRIADPSDTLEDEVWEVPGTRQRVRFEEEAPR